MEPSQAKIADLWCRLMHTAPMWPSHGQYECRTCGRRHPGVLGKAPAPLAPAPSGRPCEGGRRATCKSVKTPRAVRWSADQAAPHG